MSVHLHARSCYTLLNSTLRVPQLVALAKQAGYEAIACTDENVMHGAMEFWKCCQREQIKPIFGLEILVNIEEETVAMTVLARDDEGFGGLMAASSRLCDGQDALTLDQIQPYLEHWVLIVYGEGGFAESELIQEDRRGLGDKLGWLKTQLPLFYMAVSFNDASFW